MSDAIYYTLFFGINQFTDMVQNISTVVGYQSWYLGKLVFVMHAKVDYHSYQ